MYIKLTRLDNSPIWLNASFIVTVEPRRGGGAIVVPIGDGLDYDVRETPSEVLALLEGVPVPTVVPVPTRDSLVPTPPDVSPEPERPEPSAPASVPMPVEPASAPVPEPPAEKPAKRKRTVRKTTKRATVAPLPLSEEQVARLVKMAPGSLKKLQNTLEKQFKVADVESTVAGLVAHGVCTLDRDHVLWAANKSEEAEA